jgi:F-type H+-transporting ATPase subunit b
MKRTKSDGSREVVGALVFSGLLFLAWAGVALAAEGGGHAGASKWPDFWYRALNFGLMAGLLFFVLRKPLRDFFAKRTRTIANTLSELETKKKEAERSYQEYNEKLAELDKETARILEEYRAQGEAEKAKIIAGAEQSAAEIQAQAERAIQQEVKSATLALKREIAELSVAAAEKVLREKVGKEDHQRLIKDFATNVVEAK